MKDYLCSKSLCESRTLKEKNIPKAVKYLYRDSVVTCRGGVYRLHWIDHHNRIKN